ncbi:unnamed protein product [Didymodactylos carnosus]|uniref:Uncharacterized protein n=2 Tax=Didymodactylos carnosus TaxID=1234261 RepID=A0A8S2EHX6_9BILA|nr:unnamed protein product [Didymodactylos carnosus]CAF3996947.1 unnamed protein product [Didymodactylos carnosus]
MLDYLLNAADSKLITTTAITTTTTNTTVNENQQCLISLDSRIKILPGLLQQNNDTDTDRCCNRRCHHAILLNEQDELSKQTEPHAEVFYMSKKLCCRKGMRQWTNSQVIYPNLIRSRINDSYRQMNTTRPQIRILLGKAGTAKPTNRRMDYDSTPGVLKQYIRGLQKIKSTFGKFSSSRQQRRLTRCKVKTNMTEFVIIIMAALWGLSCFQSYSF